jgi:hypothetical protein
MLVTLGAGGGRAADMPIFDAHIHYSQSDVAERLAYRNGDRLFPVEMRPAGARGSAHE